MNELIGFWTVIVLLFALPEASTLRKKAAAKGVKAGFLRCLVLATASTFTAFAVGIGAGWAILFGPSQANGDFIGTPWIMMPFAVVAWLLLTWLIGRWMGALMLYALTRAKT